MAYLFWGVLNLLVFFGWLWVGSTLLFNRKSNKPIETRLYSVVFILGLVSILTSNSKNEHGNQKSYDLPATMEHLELKRTFTHHLDITIIRDKASNQLLPQFTHAQLTGFVAGLNWRLLGLNEVQNQLQISGVLSWKLMGFELYNQPQTFIIATDEKN
ncbi:hypothetical protein V8V91_24680 [Algoriphagus halophilus]|uniref:hypothetical protein n=1 Tax=Algoriphagus halophilus TaxID=226505 RepID=UPI00358DFCB9